MDCWRGASSGCRSPSAGRRRDLNGPPSGPWRRPPAGGAPWPSPRWAGTIAPNGSCGFFRRTPRAAWRSASWRWRAAPPCRASPCGSPATCSPAPASTAPTIRCRPWTPKGGFRVDRALIFALIRQESAFNPKARSWAGASGLMQLMPRTAGFVANDRRYRGAKRRRLFEPALNLELGQTYVEMPAGQFQSQRRPVPPGGRLERRPRQPQQMVAQDQSPERPPALHREHPIPRNPDLHRTGPRQPLDLPQPPGPAGAIP